MTGYTSSAKYKSLEDIQRDSSELCLCYCGWEQCEPGHRYGPNRRRNYVLHFVSKGSGKLEVNGNQYHIKKGEAFLLPPATEAWYEADKEDPWFYSWVGFTGSKAKACVDNAGFSVKKPVRSIACLSHIQELIEKISGDALVADQAVQLLMVAKYLEKIGDYAVNVSEWAKYLVTGVHKEYQ